jgi:hypothetical protein
MPKLASSPEGNQGNTQNPQECPEIDDHQIPERILRRITRKIP